MIDFEYNNASFLGARYSDMTRNIRGHMHDYYELNFLTCGKTKMRINEKIIEYESYDFLLIPPNMEHLLFESERAKFDNYVIWFQKPDNPPSSDQIIKLHDYDGTVQFLCAQIYQTFMRSQMEDKELIDLYLKAVLCHMKNGLILNTRHHAHEGSELTENAVKFINATVLSRRISVEDVANQLGVTPAHLTRVFQKKIGISPIKYMNAMKIAEAKRLLHTESISIKEIAARLHYSDPLYFSKQFSQLTGLSPSQYRIACKQETP